MPNYAIFLKILRSDRLRIYILSNNISDIGKFTTIERCVNLNADQKRLWFEKIRNVNDKRLIDSMAINLDFIPKKNL